MPGNAAPTVTVLHGEDGFSRLARLGRFTVADPRTYRGTCRTMCVDGLQLSEWSTTPIAGSVPPSAIQSAVVLLAVLEGELDCRVDSHHAAVGVGNVCVLNATRPIRFAARLQTRLLRFVVPSPIVPGRLLPIDGIISSSGPTRLSQCLTSLAEVTLESTSERAFAPAGRALRALTTATLEELLPVATGPDLRTEIVAHIERDLANPDLGPRTIADAFGMSVRWVHHLFNDDQESVAHFIRLRRLDAVAAHLAVDRRFPSINLIAERNGFTSRDALTRAFKARYGMTIADYAEFAAKGPAPAPLDLLPDRTTPFS